MSWVQAICQLSHGQVIAVDGKTLRRSHDKSNGKSAIHMASAWTSANGIVLGQIKTAEKSNEITAIPKLIKTLEIKGCIATIDAMGCQKNIAKTIIENGAEYVLALKDNQATLHDNVQLFFQDYFNSTSNQCDCDFYQSTDCDHGRIEIRKYWDVIAHGLDLTPISERQLRERLKKILHFPLKPVRRRRIYLSAIS